ncbi:UDP-N-acetylmuramoyl-L-alanine--D-glutamate ligase [Photobacterium phosphoreum]|jgi:UDP-N-acetylmuramoylalanine--D-glutamate ligase|uniref:UDP-N-acetylmuramoyl-L-alanine--D-glutamate ligase n=1 Tax=Photobacterium phosphoreum TaxID=659 RepID=UPI0007F8AB43|nr:UDP-N-acetylmuramoyl-L-alanine--D-glutamate ligase [Photobacterium phosphoreum]MCD9475698.1 UDP-N-acetylmuramoyl-L-alanine--D-glutamate ligase [Photobacterium phosphoreum]MCF2176493.1 UDP-N-acetylmuramoyl-L-alanine--D-glutamate ligase [Photobacterium phosphoreum]OBU40278.1 UDP-N-acetylmuramoylalanine--D-glutamate ligase [Photobacterium phosphoreum]PSU66196.1 UDP-N-acetylmuramoyl-L-alanine--D-glutamate ligase [Photobacterium phosphoreum]PSU74360.1 UDP-N-acetylmuramoyl-L-alanine--D-glutamate 
MNGLAGINKVVVIGLGMTGLSVVNHLVRLPQSLDIKVIDTRDNPPGQDQLPAGVDLCAGLWNLQWLLDADLIVASPGIALATPELFLAAQSGVELVGDIELFARAVNKPVIAITGSNGKSTVTSLVGEMAKEAGVNVGVGGNIGFAALDMLAQDHDLYVLELSSFQLETTSSLALEAAVYLNLSEDHMDRYPGGLADYSNAKMRIFEHAKLAVYNRDDLATKPDFNGNMTSFGFDNADYGLVMVDGAEWLAISGEPLMAVSEIALVGRHNVANCLAALALADAVGIDRVAACQTMRRYTGLAHRCQLAVNRHGVKWVNDSKATNLASTVAALTGLQLAGKLHLLMGGDGKGADFSELKPVLADLNVQLYCFGRDGHLFSELVENAINVDTMSEAMDRAAATAQAGDMVLLSPACASWDQFANFMARGDAFVEQAIRLQDSVSGNM